MFKYKKYAVLEKVILREKQEDCYAEIMVYEARFRVYKWFFFCKMKWAVEIHEAYNLHLLKGAKFLNLK